MHSNTLSFLNMNLLSYNDAVGPALLFDASSKLFARRTPQHGTLTLTSPVTHSTSTHARNIHPTYQPFTMSSYRPFPNNLVPFDPT